MVPCMLAGACIDNARTRKQPINSYLTQIKAQCAGGPAHCREVVMGWSLNIGSVAGTAIRIHVTFLLFLAWIFGVSYVAGGAQAAWNGLLFIVL